MNSKFLLPVIIFVTLFIATIIVLILLNIKRKNKLKKTIEELDLEKNSIIGIPILSELSKVRELVKTDDLKQKLSYWDETINEIKENKIDILTDLITEADFLIERKDYKNALKKIANIEINLETIKKKTDTLLEEIKVITKSEERNRSLITKLKAIFRECENKYERRKKDYDELEGSIEAYLNKIDKGFKKFETYMDRNDYISVEKIVIDLENEINLLKNYLDKTPDLILMAKMMIPNKVEETKTAYFRMQRDGYPLDYLNIEYNIKEINEKVNTIINNLKEFNMENADIELKTILEYFNTIFNSFDKDDICITYDSNVNGKVLSLIMKVEDYSYADSAVIYYFRSYNVNLESHEIVDNDMLFSYFDLTSDVVYSTFNQKLEEYYYELVNGGGISRSCNYECFIKDRGFEDGYDDIEFYVKEGKLIAYKPYINISQGELKIHEFNITE